MTYGNPHLRMRWHDLAPRLLNDDMDEIVERLRVAYPNLVLFPRGLHFPDHREPRYATMPVKFYASFRDYVGNPWLEDRLSPLGLALRVPWPDDVASCDPERLIGGRKRLAYEDGIATYRRFGRIVYLSSGISEEIVAANKGPIAEIVGVAEAKIPDIHYFRYGLSRSNIEFLYDTGDKDMQEFVRTVRSCMRGLTTSTSAVYDILTKEPVRAFSSRPQSLRLNRQCALVDNLYLGPCSSTGRRVEFIGPHPKLARRWREQAGLPYLSTTDPRSLKLLDRLALINLAKEEGSKRLPSTIGPSDL